MLFKIKLEKLLFDATEAKVTRIYKGVGDEINAGEILFDLEGGKANVPVKSEYSGKIESIAVEVGQVVKIGDILAIVNGEKAEAESPTKASGNYDYFSLLKPQERVLECDIVILGGGPGGYVAAIQAAKLGAQVVLVEKDAVGGTCLNRGCIPTKAMVRSAEIYNNLKEAEYFGCFVENIGVDIKKVVSRKNRIVNQLVQGIHNLLDKHKVKLVSGLGEIRDQKTVFVKKNMEETTIMAKNIIIATGSASSLLNVPGAGLENVITCNQVMQLDELPRKMVIIGGGVIGMEFAFIFANFGVEVTVVEYLNECLSGFDKDICEEITQIAVNKGIRMYFGAKVEEIIKSEDGMCVVSFTQEGKVKYILADKVLMAVGRKPFFEGLGVEKLGIELNDSGRGIKVNERMQTNIPNIYAIGDVTGKLMLAHVASHQGMVAVKNIMGDPCQIDYNAVPSAIFTDSEIAAVGMGEKDAVKEGIEIEVGKFPFAANGKALTLGENRGFIKIIKEKSTGKIIGCTILGPHSTDLIAELTLAVKNQLTAKQIGETIHAHPTTAEVVHEAALTLEGGAIHFYE